ncbi:MAG: hypothetical protein QOG62_1277 [Thermoleophilaceae bacterium]|nr:hypothetical protein [Thermoleophilaceae bacterium]
MLDKAFSQSIGSAQMNMSLNLTLQGIPAATDPIRVSLEGPYKSGTDEVLPSFDLAASLDAGSLPAPGDTLSLISTGSNLYLDIAGTAYEAGEDAVAKELASRKAAGTGNNPFGVDPQSWVQDPKIVGEEQVDGVDTLHLTGTVSVGNMIQNLNSAAAKAAAAGDQQAPTLTPDQLAQIEQVVQNPTFDLYAGKDDGKIRRLSASVNFTVPEDQRQQIGGLSSGRIAFALNFTGVGKPVTITAPTSAQPLKNLAQQIQALTGAVQAQGGGSAQAGGASGGASGSGGAAGGGTTATEPTAPKDTTPPAVPQAGADPQAFKDYTDCLAAADPNDTSALDECQKLIAP